MVRVTALLLTLAVVAALAAAPAGLAAQPVAPVPAAVGTAAASPAPSPLPTPVAAPTPGPTPAPSASPSPTPNPYAYIITPPSPAPGAPTISEIAINDREVHSGGPYAIRVTTSLDVTSVEVDAYGARFPLLAAGPGLWTIAGQVPNVPFLFRNRTYTATVIAWAGTKTETNFDVSIKVAP